jgi:hypothetical protein
MSNHREPRKAYNLLEDPIYYIAIIAFAALATGLPALLGSPVFLAVAQTAALWLMLLVPLRRNRVRPAVIVLALWVVIQIVTVFALTLAAPNRLEEAVGNGFLYREALLNWLYAGTALPDSWFSQPMQHLLEIAGVLLGSIISGGLVGVWFLLRAVNDFAFGAAALVGSAGGIAGFMAALQPWMLLRIMGYVGLLPFLAMPGFTGDWQPWRLSSARSRLMLTALLLLVAGLLLELFLPALWAAWFGGLVS